MMSMKMDIVREKKVRKYASVFDRVPSIHQVFKVTIQDLLYRIQP